MGKSNVEKYRDSNRDKVNHLVYKCPNCGMEVCVPAFMKETAESTICKDCYDRFDKMYKYRRK